MLLGLYAIMGWTAEAAELAVVVFITYFQHPAMHVLFS